MHVCMHLYVCVCVRAMYETGSFGAALAPAGLFGKSGLGRVFRVSRMTAPSVEHAFQNDFLGGTRAEQSPSVKNPPFGFSEL